MSTPSSLPFDVGDKLVCVDASAHLVPGCPLPPLVKDMTYSVQAIWLEGSTSKGPVYLVSLTGQPLARTFSDGTSGAWGWGYRRFRRVWTQTVFVSQEDRLIDVEALSSSSSSS